MRIVIDLQGAQTESRFRGIGRYSLSLAQAIARNRGEHEIILALSGLFPETIETIRAAFEGVLPQENIRVWYAPGPVREMEPDNISRREVAQFIREAFLVSLKPDVIHISSLFEGYGDDAVTSIGCFDTVTPVSVSLYDLIPLLNPDHYLKPNPSYGQYYLRKIEYIKKAAIYLAISEYSRQEGFEYLGVSESNLVNISTAIDSHFQSIHVDEGVARQIFNKFGLARPFILYTGGADERKNLPRLIQAFAALPANVRNKYQLLLAGKVSQGEHLSLLNQAKSAGLRPDELCFTGYVTEEELVQLYNLCELFVFPSWHEGFGLPALEAMACGAPVIGANTSSLPEVIDLDLALFDPLDVSSITAKMTQALEDEALRAVLRAHGLQQAKRFSWDVSARRAITAFESLAKVQQRQPVSSLPPGRKPRLAFVSPLPPARTGIADYSSELLPALAEYYDLELVVAQDQVDDPWVNQYGKVRDVNWLYANFGEVDRVLYQIGNSPFHQHMLSLMQEIPGVVVLHDFYLSGLMAWQELHAGMEHVWTKALYDAHGYGAVRERYRDTESAKLRYPVNLHVLQYAQGLIVHSEFSKKLSRLWYEDSFTADWEVIPHLRSPAGESDKARIRQELGIGQEDFVICSFGFLDSTKLNHRLLEAWLGSALAMDKRCRLIFVGENHGGNYGERLLQIICKSRVADRVKITGFVSSELFKSYLAVTDLAVQLRTNSRGETSGAVLDCMNHALPIIVNANGSMADLNNEAVWMLPDEFEDMALVEAIETLWRDPDRCADMAKRASNIILTQHAPVVCAKRYAEAIERFNQQALTAVPALVHRIAAVTDFKPSDVEIRQFAKAISTTLPLMRPAKRLLLDISATCRTDLKTGIERVARALLLVLLDAPPEGFRIEPVYLSDTGSGWKYRYARHYILDLLGCSQGGLDDEIVEPESGDVLLGLDLSGDILVQANHAGLFAEYRAQGVSIYFMVHDILPVRMSNVFPPGADQSYMQWLQAVAHFDGVICVSRAVADDLSAWLVEEGISRAANQRSFGIFWSHHGADFACSAPSSGLPDDAEWTLQQLSSRPSFLMVGTIEPRKGYLQAIQAFGELWRNGEDINLVIVGREGWKPLLDEARRDIPETVDYLKSHPELNKRLFWLEGVSDEYLEKVYSTSSCLIAASYGEGFGLPLIEAAQHKLPIIARDIPVFREVAGEHAHYFKGLAAEDLAAAIDDWLRLYEEGRHPTSDSMPWLTWKESAERLKRVLLNTRAPVERSV
ncbi:Glycosyltransferase involved in cell wall bisynthesis [Azotobacter beijerinckii]|uniref:Glycosyltransferase involved in cell wall bisynthesis n=1 Tax=Azotobacter beijerinckii TaxID=170623 RepID=A0A1H9GQX1_9GAMM|nr:glycosyltransferase [Azotobacter beijerinckii]SEQ52492.1 Glycosyltransferase involved in cell wall bisynthesis [Azotobacter beijerinckii]